VKSESLALNLVEAIWVLVRVQLRWEFAPVDDQSTLEEDDTSLCTPATAGAHGIQCRLRNGMAYQQLPFLAGTEIDV
jgi:hypothetical protein